MISVIVPVYKAEKYLRRCIDSILAQTYTDFELLLIDDGSPDRSGEICDEYAKQDSRVRVFHKPNGGVSSARNLGLDNAKGDWITFVDADDYIHSDFLTEYAKYNDVDLVVGSFEVVGTDEKWTAILSDSYYDFDSFRSVFIDLVLRINFTTPWCKFFKRNLLKDLRFDEKVISGEDTIFVLKYINVIKNLRTNSCPYYFYDRSNPDGLSQNSKYFYPYFYAMDILYTTVCELVPRYGSKVIQIYRSNIVAYCIRQLYHVYKSKENFKCKYDKLSIMCNNNHLMKLFNDTSAKRRKKTQLFHRLMSNKNVLFAYIYLHILKGRIYQ